MATLTSFRAIIDLWPTRSALSDELGHEKSEMVRKWWQRDSIPADCWAAIVVLPRSIGAGVTLELLAGLAAREREVA